MRAEDAFRFAVGKMSGGNCHSSIDDLADVVKRIPHNVLCELMDLVKEMEATSHYPEPKTPNAETQEAMRELADGRGVAFKTVDELFDDLNDRSTPEVTPDNLDGIDWHQRPQLRETDIVKGRIVISETGVFAVLTGQVITCLRVGVTYPKHTSPTTTYIEEAHALKFASAAEIKAHQDQQENMP